MKIDKITVDKLANLARLELTDEQAKKIGDDLGNILDWVEQLDEVDTDHVEPLGNVNEEEAPLRVDKANNFFKGEEALENAPEKEGRYFVVPKVLS
ncbi:MAG: Asp-tRNA(Asn)/Glu-tRNA(Gln) amidotransferase subunit GatC [Reichenbachiella sp.]